MRKILVLSLLLAFPFHFLVGQTAWQHVSDKGIYQFLDELATMHIIDITTAIKPMSREDIATALTEAEGQWSKLTGSQKARLDYYLQEYAMERGQLKTGLWQLNGRDSTLSVHLLPPEVGYRDSLFRIVMRPVYGYRNFSGGNHNFWVTYGGAEAISYIGKNWAVYVSLRDNYQKGERLAQPTYLTQEPGGTYKVLTGGGAGGEFSEMRGGITYNWAWGTIGLVKDHVQWGDNQHGANIFSGRTPSFPMIKLHANPAKWIEFNYYHGWLVSEAIDSIRSYFPEEGNPRTVNRQMYIAANMLTLKPFERLHLSFGNSIVYGDMPVQLAYLIPFFFYKSLVHTLHWGATFQNSGMYINLSSRLIPNLHLHATYFIDEFSIRRIGDPTRHNFTSFKGGFSLADWPLRNVTLFGEYTFTNPITFLHDEPTTRFRSNRYNLGHYLQDNAEEYYAGVRIYPGGTLELAATWVYARKGNYYQYIRGRRNPRIDEMPVLDEITWQNNSVSFEALVRPISNMRVFAKYTLSDIQGFDVDDQTAEYYLNLFSAPYLHGQKNILEIGFGMGF
ncbi:MAG: hypothetical protein ACOCX0_02025 [Bacteroidota bacterium]